MVKKAVSRKTRTAAPPAPPEDEHLALSPYIEDESVFEQRQIPLIERSEDKNLSPVERRWLDSMVDIRDKPTDFSRSFFARQLVQCTLPHSNPGQIPIWERVNGDLKLSIRPYFATDRGFLYPYGTLPRVFLSWLVTEAVRTRSRRIHLGQSFSDFLRLLGLNPSNGGKRSDTVRLRDQLERLLRATISFEQTTPGSKRKSWIDMQIAPKAVVWWDSSDTKSTQGSLFESYIMLSEDFYDAITAAPVPVDLRALRGLRSSSLALDLYTLLAYETWRASESGNTRTIPWTGLKEQIGSEYKSMKRFKEKVREAIPKIERVFLGLKVSTSEAGLSVKPGTPAIPSKTAVPKTLSAGLTQPDR